MTALSARLETIIALLGRLAGWLFVVLVALIILDIGTRAIPGFSYHVWQNLLGNALSSTRLQELQWHVHTVLFSSVMGYAYLRNAQVRIDLWRERRSKTTKLWIEIAGIVLFLLPLCAVLVGCGVGFVEHSWRSGETSPAVGGFVLGSIFGGIATPTEASGVGALGAILLAWCNGRLDGKTFRSVIDASAVTIGMVFLLIVAATCFAYVFRSLGGELLVRDAMRAIPVGDWGILLGIMGIVFLLGIYLDWIEILLIVLPVFHTVFQNLDFTGHVAKSEQMFWFAILLAVNLQNSFLSPPFGATLFYLKGTAPRSVTLADIYWGVTPFMLLQLVGLALIIAVPDLVLWLPRGMLD